VTDWPFSTAELTAGLRRYFAEPSLRVRGLTALSNRQGGRGLAVHYTLGAARQASPLSLECVVKEPGGTRRAGLAHPGVCEAGVFRSLGAQLPMITPALIAADPQGRWLVVESVDGEPLGSLLPDALEPAVDLLAGLHERFWGLADDLSTYPWLGRPLTLDYEIHVYAAAQALTRVVRDEWPPRLAESPEALARLGQIISSADQVVGPLRALPFTLLHGRFWAGSLLRDETGDLVVLDWQRASIGPGLLDVVTLVTTSLWEGEPLDARQVCAAYRAALARRVGLTWSDAEWDEMWDHALLWRCQQEMLTWLAAVPPEGFAARAERFETVWLEPVLAAASRRLPDAGQAWPLEA
jgi:hypothetical protein